MTTNVTGLAPRQSALLHQVWNEDGILQVIASGTASAATTTIYTVPASRLAYITSVQLSILHTAAVARVVTLGIYDSGAVLQASWGFDVNAVDVAAFALSLVPPVQLTAAWSIRLVSPNADTPARAMITGYAISPV